MSVIRHCGAMARRIASVPKRQCLQTTIIVKPLNVLPVKLYQSHQSYRGYKNFGHNPEKMPTFTKYWQAFLVLSMFGFCLDWKTYVISDI